MKLTDNNIFDPSKPGYNIRAANKSADIFIYEEIGDGWMGGLSAKKFADDMKALGKLDTINLFINSPGGSVFDGWAIYTQLKRSQARVNVQVDGLAASIASLIAMAGDEITMTENSLMMVHRAWTVAAGNAEEMRSTAEVLDKIDVQLVDTYTARTGMDRQDIENLLAAETWMTPDEAVANGFAEKKVEGLKIAACAFDLSRFKNAPKSDTVVEPKPQPKQETDAEFRKAARERISKYEMEKYHKNRN